MYTLYMTCGIPGWEIEIHSEELSVLQSIRMTFPDMTYPDAHAKCLNHITVRKLEEKFMMCYLDIQILVSHEDQIIYRIGELLDVYTMRIDNGLVILHGGLIEKNGQCFALIAPTKTGKSTFLVYLAFNGFKLLSDDFIFIDPNTLQAYGYPMPVNIRDKSILPAGVESYLTHEGFVEYRKEYLSMFSLFSEVNNCFKLSSFLFLYRGPEKSDPIKRINSGLLFQKLILNQKTILNLNQQINNCFDLAQCCEGYELNTEDLQAAHCAVESLCCSHGVAKHILRFQQGSV